MLTFMEFIIESSDEYLYHATYRSHKDSIAKDGLRTNSGNNNWYISKKRKVYLAKSPKIARSYAKTSYAPQQHHKSGIVVYKVHRKHLEPKHIKVDKNVKNNDTTVEYGKNIPSKHLKIHSEHDT